MEEGVFYKGKNIIYANVDSPCPLDWLAEYYQKHKGKIVEIDDTLLNFILTNADSVRKINKSDRQTNVYALWHAGVGETGIPYPETKVKVEIHGHFNLGDNANRNFITRVAADDIPNYGFNRSLENSNAGDIVFLIAKNQHSFETQLDKKFDVTYNGKKLKK